METTQQATRSNGYPQTLRCYRMGEEPVLVGERTFATYKLATAWLWKRSRTLAAHGVEFVWDQARHLWVWHPEGPLWYLPAEHDLNTPIHALQKNRRTRAWWAERSHGCHTMTPEQLRRAASRLAQLTDDET